MKAKRPVHFYFKGEDGMSGAFCVYGMDNASAWRHRPWTKDEAKVTCPECLADLRGIEEEAKADAS